MTTLLLADVKAGELSESTSRALGAALALGSPVHVLVAGHGVEGASAQAAGLTGVAKVLVADAPLYRHNIAEAFAELLVGLSPGYDAFVGSASSTAKSVMPRLAACLDVMQISEITRVEAPDTFERPIYAGNAVQTVQSQDRIRVVTVRTASFAKVEVRTGASAPIEPVACDAQPWFARFESEALSTSERPDLASARIIVSGGRGMQSAENFRKFLEPVADRLGAALGASRAAVDSGFAPNDWQVGQTGKVVAPDLYVAVGISGAIQHLAGMKDSRVIVAINKDEEAPIFQVADYGLAADLFQALPQLLAELEKGAK